MGAASARLAARRSEHPPGRSLRRFRRHATAEHYEQLPERAWFTEIHYLALVCDDGKLAERLRQRPAWRGATQERIEEMQDVNRWLKAHAASTTPPMTLLDTNDAHPSETVAAVTAWVRERLARFRSLQGKRAAADKRRDSSAGD